MSGAYFSWITRHDMQSAYYIEGCAEMEDWKWRIAFQKVENEDWEMENKILNSRK